MESILADKFATQNMPQLAFFYFIEYTKIKLDVFELSKHFNAELEDLISTYFDVRAQIKQEYLKNPNFLLFDHCSALPELDKKKLFKRKKLKKPKKHQPNPMLGAFGAAQAAAGGNQEADSYSEDSGSESSIKSESVMGFGGMGDDGLSKEERWFRALLQIFEILHSHPLYLHACYVEHLQNYRRFFGSRFSVVLDCAFEDRIELYMQKDIEENTEMLDVWNLTK